VAEPVIHAESLVRADPDAGEHDVLSVDGLSFDVARGESLGLLGPGGTGKSATIKMIGAVSGRTGGRLSVLGLDPDDFGPEVRSRLGLVPQHDSLDPGISVHQNLFVYARYFGLSTRECTRKTDELLALLGLSADARTRVERLPLAARRRLLVARGLVNDPRILLLDEPTTQLDTRSRLALWDRFAALREGGTTIVLATPRADEAQQLCDRVVLLDTGRVLAAGTPDELIRRHAGREALELQFGLGQNRQAGRQLYGIGDRLEVLPDRVLVYADNGERTLAAVVDRGLEPVNTLVRRTNLADVFLRLAGRMLEE